MINNEEIKKNLAELKEKLGYSLDIPESQWGIFDPDKRFDFSVLFDATNCNPNGDPDSDNMPRCDSETQHGLVTDVCIKRKIRDFIAGIFGTADKNDINSSYNLYVKHQGLLTVEHTWTKQFAEASATTEANQKLFREKYFDVRFFGAVLNTGKEKAAAEIVTEEIVAEEGNESTKDTKNTKSKRSSNTKTDHILKGGQCTGAIMIDMAESIDPIQPYLMSISRVALVDNDPRNKDAPEYNTKALNATFGNKAGQPYGLYMFRGHYAPSYNKDGLITSMDLILFWNALQQMFVNDFSASRMGRVNPHAVFIFAHEHPLGNYPAHKLFERIVIKRKEDVEVARKYQDYDVCLDSETVPGVMDVELFNDWK